MSIIKEYDFLFARQRRKWGIPQKKKKGILQVIQDSRRVSLVCKSGETSCQLDITSVSLEGGMKKQRMHENGFGHRPDPGSLLIRLCLTPFSSDFFQSPVGQFKYLLETRMRAKSRWRKERDVRICIIERNITKI